MENNVVILSRLLLWKGCLLLSYQCQSVGISVELSLRCYCKRYEGFEEKVNNEELWKENEPMKNKTGMARVDI